MRREGKQVHLGPLLELAIYNHVKVTYHGLDPRAQEYECEEEGVSQKGP